MTSRAFPLSFHRYPSKTVLAVGLGIFFVGELTGKAIKDLATTIPRDHGAECLNSRHLILLQYTMCRHLWLPTPLLRRWNNVQCTHLSRPNPPTWQFLQRGFIYPPAPSEDFLQSTMFTTLQRMAGNCTQLSESKCPSAPSNQEQAEVWVCAIGLGLWPHMVPSCPLQEEGMGHRTVFSHVLVNVLLIFDMTKL